MMKISLLCHTARSSYCIVGAHNLNLFSLLCDSVLAQDFEFLNEVEVVFIDARYSERHNSFGLDGHSFNGKTYPFKLKHIDQTLNNPYFNHGLWVEALALNKGIVAAEGELLMTIADKSTLHSKNILSRAWNYYKNEKRFLLLGWQDVVFCDGSIKILSNPDHRYFSDFSKSGPVFDAPGSWLYGYSFYSLDSALNVNGYDVSMDCIKGVVDCDFGVRLESIGNTFVIDTNLVVYRHAVERDAVHVPVVGPVMAPKGTFKTNVGILLMNHADKRSFVNDRILSEKDLLRAWEFFRQAEVNNNTDYYPEKGTSDYALLQWWYKNQIVYNLKNMRAV